MIPVQIAFKLLHPLAEIPYQGSFVAAGYDVKSVVDMSIAPGHTELVPLGFAADMPDHVHGQMKTRSGMAAKGMVVLAGVIDSDYRGEWRVILHNAGATTYDIAAGDRVAQIVFTPTIKASFHTVEELSETVRGAGGYGSTGR